MNSALNATITCSLFWGCLPKIEYFYLFLFKSKWLLSYLSWRVPPELEINSGGIFMTKISINTKIKAVEEYANGTASLTAIRSKYGISKLEFQICVGIYAKFGKQPLLNPPRLFDVWWAQCLSTKQIAQWIPWACLIHVMRKFKELVKIGKGRAL